MLNKKNNPFSHYYNTNVWKSQVLSKPPITSTGPRPTTGLIGYAGILDPPRKRPFERAYSLSPLKYFQYGTQQIYKQKDKYDKEKEEAAHYTKYLAGLMLRLRKQASGAASHSGLSPDFFWQTAHRTLRRYNASRGLARYMLLANRLRHETGELNYNPLFQSYNERKTWFTPRPHWWNYSNYFQSQRIFRDFREAQARRDYYIKQIRRVGPLIDQALEWRPPAPDRKLEKQPCGTWEYVWSKTLHKKVPHWRPCERPLRSRYTRQTHRQYGRRYRSTYSRRTNRLYTPFSRRRPSGRYWH